MTSTLAAVVFAIVSASAAPQDETATPPAAPIGPDAVWIPPEGFRAATHEACDKAKAGTFGACFVSRMEKAGASPAAVAFARRTGDQGVLLEFRDAGVVDVALAEYPFRANENRLCFLVNGDPPMLDVDDISRLDREALAATPAWAALAKTYPNLAIFPGRRFGLTFPASQRLKSGGQRFVVDYSLRDGCHACAIAGTLRLGLEFDVNGKFAGTKIMAVRAMAR
jgi:hypothetical protein